jgi:hypothetical protein
MERHGPPPKPQPLPRVYKCPPPTSQEARRIWEECDLARADTESSIIDALNIWAYFNSELYDAANTRGEIVMHIRWISPTNIAYSMTWDAFLHWFRCTLG